jgi:hypothetical protein
MDLEDGSMEDIPTRPMRVKILYTFDQDSKTNCLARIPDVLNIPAVAIDETSQVGVIELKQCIQAIVSASPEIVSRLSDGDFTIYAFDYSECDTPQVGQGMLSAALVAATPPGQANNAMITGRVCQNKVALLSNGVKEILEVKLRLVPVPRPAQAQQSDFAKGMNLGGERSMSPAVSTGFDPNVWNQNSKSQQQQMNDYFNFDSMSTTATGGDRDNALVDDIFGLGTSSSGSGGSGHQLAGGVGIPETPNDPFNPAFSHSAPGSRAGSPIIPPESGSRNDLLRHQSFSGRPSNLGGHAADNSRPGSRASVRGEVNHHRQASTPTLQHPQPQQQRQEILQQTEVYYNEDGQPRKRAKVMQTDWRGRSSFGSKSGDLRVTASTAASMHMIRPIAKRPAAPGSNLEPPPRVPTPVPQRTALLPQQQIAPRRSLLRQASAADSDFMSDAENFSDAIVSSPEDGDDSPGNSITAEGTPQEIPSSPPVFPGMHPPQPSSPGLPTFPPPGRLADSGYMSDPRGFGSNVVESLERDEADRSPDAQDYDMAARYKSRKDNTQSQLVIGSDGMASVHAAPPTYPSEGPSEMNINLETPGDMNQLPNRMLLNIPPQRKEREGSQGYVASTDGTDEIFRELFGELD